MTEQHTRSAGIHSLILMTVCRSLHTGTLMSTLTRKRSTAEYLPKYELITYSRASIIPTSHVHLYDPENITLACTTFRVSHIDLEVEGKLI